MRFVEEASKLWEEVVRNKTAVMRVKKIETLVISFETLDAEYYYY